MGNNPSTPKDFYWSSTDEPHASRRREILKKYPQVTSLYGHDTSTKFVVLGWVSMQFAMAYLTRDLSWGWIALAAYCIGAWPTHALFLAMHEISHNLAFAKPVYNRLLGCFANSPTVIPHFSMLQKYHMEHHQYQGVDGIDTDVPTTAEGKYFTNTLKKMLFVFIMPALYGIRPLFVKQKSPGLWEAINWSFVFTADILVWYYWGPKALGYLFLSVWLGSGLHPVAGHFIAEHYVFIKGQETYSYYGPLNAITFNVGYHNEHHDFPRIPGSRLPTLKKMAPEFYTMPSYTSWTKVIWDYITDPSIGPYSRMKRLSKKQKISKEEVDKDY